MQKLQAAGYNRPFYSLEEGVGITFGTTWQREKFINFRKSFV